MLLLRKLLTAVLKLNGFWRGVVVPPPTPGVNSYGLNSPWNSGLVEDNRGWFIKSNPNWLGWFIPRGLLGVARLAPKFGKNREEGKGDGVSNNGYGDISAKT